MRKYLKQVQYTEKLEQLFNVASTIIEQYSEVFKSDKPEEVFNLIADLWEEFDKQHKEVVKSRP